MVALVPETCGLDYVGEVRAQIGETRLIRSTAGGRDEGILALPTSGSTGRPKLVALPISRIERFIAWGVRQFSFHSGTVSLSLSPWNFDVSLLDTWAALAAGGTVVAANAQRLAETEYVANLLNSHDVTFVQTVPSTLDALVRAGNGKPLSSVTDVVLTGGVAGAATRQAAVDLFPHARFHNVYGSTEVNDCLLYTASPETFAAADSVPLGAPIAGCEVHLAHDGRVLPLTACADGVRGELFVRTPWMAAGYLNHGRIEALSDSDAGQELYPMRDRVELVDGQLRYLGRSDRTVKLRGQRVNLDEVEQAACATGVVGAACAWVGPSDSGEELRLAYTGPDNGPKSVSGIELRLALSRRLPPYAMPNRLYAFEGPFPVNANGKPDLRQIRTEIERA
ncbi:AMP-binding protein [Plantactinospora sp. WMMB334]|uniref:AMP-binding protein n=1 Tax=Plantactinospora sp. WMMB334 TaxID=3404119 RepID=UPI003B926347